MRKLGCVDDTGVHSGGGEFVEARTQVGRTLGLKKVVEGAHFRFVVGAPRDFCGAGEGQLGVGRLAVAFAGKLRSHAQAFADYFRLTLDRIGDLFPGRLLDLIGLATIAPRRAATWLDVAKPHAPHLPAGHIHTRAENAVLRQFHRVDVDDPKNRATQDGEQRMRVRVSWGADRFLLWRHRIEDGVGNAQWNRVGGDFVFVYLHRAENAELDAHPRPDIVKLKTGLGCAAWLAVAINSPARHERAVTDNHFRSTDRRAGVLRFFPFWSIDVHGPAGNLKTAKRNPRIPML